MSDCIKCWSTPCFCGHEYESYSRKARIELAAAVLGIPESILTTLVSAELDKQEKKSDK